MRGRICLVTTGQPSTNPRLVKEADALVEAGFAVEVIGAHWTSWAHDADRRLLASRQWRCMLIDWRREAAPLLFWKTRIRHRVARELAQYLASDTLRDAATSRITPELTRRALATPADLYIAHTLGARPAAAAAAARHGAKLGFDAEDFHRGQFALHDQSSERRVTEQVECRYLPRCNYVTAASPLIAHDYAKIATNGVPTCVLNVFPLAARPRERRPAGGRGPLKLYWFSQTVGPDRGLDDVVRAMGCCENDGIQLYLRGAWSPGYQSSLQSLAAAAGVKPDRIVPLPLVDPDDMIGQAADFDAGLAVETGATVNNDLALSNKLFTYLLAGVAVIATRTRGQRALLEDLGSSARGYDPGDIHALAGILDEWSHDRAALDATRAAAWALGESRYNWDAEKLRFLRVVVETLGTVTAPRHAIEDVAGAASSVRGSALARS